MLLDSVTVITTIYWIVKHIEYFSHNVNTRPEDRIAVIINRMQTDKAFDIKYIVAILTGIQFTRILLSLRANRTFGPMVKTVSSMFYDLAVFLIVYLTIFFIFVT